MHHFIFKSVRASIFLALALIFTSAQAAQLDLMPDDYVVKPDTVQLAFNLLQRRQIGAYVNGSLPQNSVRISPFLPAIPLAKTVIESQVASIRLSKFMTLGEFTVAPVLVASYRNIENTSSSYSALVDMQKILGEGAQGVHGDIGVGGTLWLVNQPAKHEFLGVTAFMTLPTGDYDARKNINLSENRWRFVLSGGWVTTLGDKWVNEFSPEIAWYGDNNAYRDFTQSRYILNTQLKGTDELSQEKTYALSDTLRYKITPSIHVFSMAQINRGGKTYVNNSKLSDAADNTRIALGLLFYTQGGNQWMLRYQKDTAIENGLRLADEVTLRYMHYF
ncbi:transporter [Methylophilus aquaticus]|uniref:Transporter n=1 Tax=Methylophilus aquaticus TaxID=1971610 RepID=A0ABT9JSP1_9PROT|nr:transporter [Methylophilus aquaticus]MDP8567577.1 transporter [Methylophilus aquaticus]